MPHTLRIPSLAAIIISLATSLAPAADDYVLGPDSQRHDGVPQGKVTQHHHVSKVFEGMERDYWVYVPAQYDGKTPACLFVFQDGSGFVSATGGWRVPVVFDNLIHKGEMPVMIGVFINPGTDPRRPVPARAGQPPATRPAGTSNRAFEYDSLGDQYARFLLEEILPEVQKDYKLTNDPDGRAISGSSSGGICAFTVAWERPDQFRKVVSFIGSFTNIRGGHVYPFLIRKAPPKPLRVFLQDGTNDLDNDYGNWYLGNQQMEKAFQYANGKADRGPARGGDQPTKDRYDFKFVVGDGGHTAKHGGSILPDALRWLWRDYKKSAPSGDSK